MNKKMRVFLVTLLLSCTAVSMAFAASVKIDIYGVNDLRGALRKENHAPGIALLGGELKNQVAQNPNGSLILGAGNMLFGTLESDSYDGMPVIDAMNNIGFTANVIGSHFFNFKPEIFSGQVARARFPFLACNVQNKDGANLFKPYIIVQKQGVKIGVVGVTTMTTLREASPKNLANFDFNDPITTTQQAIDNARSEGAKIIVLLAHCSVFQRSTDKAVKGEGVKLLRRLHGVDVCFTGDSQTVVNGTVGYVPIMQGGTKGAYIAKAEINYSLDEDKILQEVPSLINVNATTTAPDGTLAALARPYIAAIDNKYGTYLAYNTTELTNSKMGQSTVAEYMTDLLRTNYKANFAIINGGAFKESLPQGNVTARHLESIYPYDGKVVVLEMKGIDILDALDYGVDNRQVGQGRFSGLKVAFEPALPRGRRVVETRLPDGSKLDPSATYTVVTNEFMANGGDGYTMMQNAISRKDAPTNIKSFFRDAFRRAGNINYRTDYRWSVGEIR